MKCIKMLLVVFVIVASSLTHAQQRVSLEQFAMDGPSFLNGKSLDEIRALADESSEEIKKVEIVPLGKWIEFHTLTFDGLEVYGFMRAANEFVPINVTVTANRWRILHGLDVGVDIAKVQEVLGEPNEINDNGFVYQTNAAEVIFVYVSDVVTKVTFSYHVD